jgi:hypothetical protein
MFADPQVITDFVSIGERTHKRSIKLFLETKN